MLRYLWRGFNSVGKIYVWTFLERKLTITSSAEEAEVGDSEENTQLPKLKSVRLSECSSVVKHRWWRRSKSDAESEGARPSSPLTGQSMFLPLSIVSSFGWWPKEWDGWGNLEKDPGHAGGTIPWGPTSLARGGDWNQASLGVSLKTVEPTTRLQTMQQKKP